MKIANLTKIVLATLILLLLASFFFNVRDTISAREKGQTFKEFLENYLGKEVQTNVEMAYGTFRSYTLKEVNSDYLVFEESSGEQHFLPFHSINRCYERKDQLHIDTVPSVSITNRSLSVRMR